MSQQAGNEAAAGNPELHRITEDELKAKDSLADGQRGRRKAFTVFVFYLYDQPQAFLFLLD